MFSWLRAGLHVRSAYTKKITSLYGESCLGNYWLENLIAIILRLTYRVRNVRYISYLIINLSVYLIPEDEGHWVLCVTRQISHLSVSLEARENVM